MKIAILMNIGIPWSRNIAQALSTQGQGVYAIDFTTNKRTLAHLAREDAFQASEILKFKQSVAGVYGLESTFRGDFRYVAAVPQLRRILKQIQPDLLLALYAGGFALLAQLSRFRPYCVWTMGSDVLFSAGLSARLSSMSLGAADLVLANGEYLASRTQSLAPRARVRPLLFGIDLDCYTRQTKPVGLVTILSNRGFNPVYQNDLIVEGLRILGSDTPDFRFIFASAGPELPRVRKQAADSLTVAANNRVTFCGGVSHEKMLRLLQDSSIFVSMARSDGTATSLLEAMACGLFPVVSDIAQNREWIRPEWNNGILVPPDNPRMLAQALGRLIEPGAIPPQALDFNRRQVEVRANMKTNLKALISSFCGLARND